MQRFKVELSSHFGAVAALLTALIASSGGVVRADNVAANEAANATIGTKPRAFSDCIQGYEQLNPILFHHFADKISWE